MPSPPRDVGLGTAYERWAIYRRLTEWLSPAPNTAAEGPIDGMAGMPGLHLLPLARRGTRVTVISPDPDALGRVARIYERAGLADRLERIASDRAPVERRFEAVVAFNFASEARDWRAHLAAQAAMSSRWLVVFATHPGSYGVAIRRALRRCSGSQRSQRPELFDHEATRPAVMRRALETHGRIVDERFVDCPWWPDLFVSAGQTLLSGAVGRPARSTPYDWGPDAFPFALRDRPEPLRRALRRHPTFDAAPAAVARWFGHHRAYLVRTDLDRAPANGSEGGGGVR